MATWRASSIVLLALTLASTSRASIVCEEVGGVPPRETTVRIVIDSPANGDVIPARTACGGKVTISGSFLVDAPPLQYDFYIVIDSSGSTTLDSGADVNRNGIFREPADNIYQAEIQAAQDFINALDWSASRVAIVRFSDAPAILRQQLTTDMPAALATLETMKGEPPRGGTYYTSALEAVRLEMLARGDLVNRLQRGIFLSDGAPSDIPTSLIDDKARELAAMGMIMDTFALGALDSTSLRSIASITRGTFTPLATPGDIVGLLPTFVPDVAYSFESVNTMSGANGIMVVDDATGTYQAIVNLVPGPNHVVLNLTAYGAPPVTVECTLDLTVPDPLTPDAGPAVAACDGVHATLDASRSISTVCGAPIFRWLDCNGFPLADWSSVPTLDIEPCLLPCETVTLEMSCPSDACSDTATTVARCTTIPSPVPAVLSQCALHASLTCGVTDPSLDVDWDLDPSTDSDGDGNPMNDADASGCPLEQDFPAGGTYDVIAWASDPVSGCTAFQRLGVTVGPNPAPLNIDGGTCPGVPASFSCGTAVAGTTYWWDFDATRDSDSDGDFLNDRDAMGCDVSNTWLAGGTPAVHGWSQDASGCILMFAEGIIDVSMVALPGEASGLRVTRAGDAITLTWTGVPGATGHRVLRGTIVPLQSTGAYDHAADDAASRGACSVLAPATTFTDPDDVVDPTGFYYLVTGFNDCGGEGPTGDAWDLHQLIARPARLPTPSCP